jgi:phosphatidylglycerol:prolipoprotein diacylglycerol transferase
MQPEIDIGPLTLQTFGLMFALGFIAAGAVLAKRFTELGKPPDWAYEMVGAGLVGGLIGARADFLIQNWSDVSDDLLGNLFSGSGLVWFGGVVGGAIGVLAWARWRRIPLWEICDIAAVPLALGYAIGRVGCQLSGDGDYGIPWDGPWAMSYPNGTVPTTEEVHPTPVYEALAVGAIAYALWRLRDTFNVGGLFSLYLVLTGAERLLVEFIRRNDDVALGLTQPQLISIVMILAGGAFLTVRARRGDLRASGAPPGADGRLATD